jgi:hypothetical protein
LSRQHQWRHWHIMLVLRAIYGDELKRLDAYAREHHAP